MNLLTKFIFGVLEDNTGVFYSHWLLKNPQYAEYVGYPFGGAFDLSNTSEPLFIKLFFFLLGPFNTVAFYNIFIFTSLLVVGVSAYFLFNHFTNHKKISAFISALFVASPYFFYQARSHVTLIQFWLVLWFIYFLTRAQTKKHFLRLGLYIAVVALISNYFAYFCLLILGCYFISKQIVYRLYKLKYWSLPILLNYTLCLLLFSVVIIALLFPYFTASYAEPAVGLSLDRTLEDFFIFSSRPWYYLLPSVDNPFIGEVSNNAIIWLQNHWQYFLTTNYFKSEHSASYLGWTNTVFALLGLYVILKSLAKKKVSYAPLPAKDLELLTFALVAILLALFTMPPYITVSGLKVYMPSMLLYELFPMFRVLTRLGIVILSINLLFTARGYIAFIAVLRSKIKATGVIVVLLPIFIVSLMEFYVPIKLTYVAQIPSAFQYIKTNTAPTSVVAVYPYGYTNVGLFWLKDFERPFINPRGFKSVEHNFDAETFTADLITCNGQLAAQEYGVNYLVVFKDADSQTHLFDESPMLSKVVEFDEISRERSIYNLASIGYAGSDESTAVYEFKSADFTAQERGSNYDCGNL